LIALAIGMPLAVSAQETQKKPQTLPTVNVSAEQDAGFKATTAANPKLTQPLIDTTQTITVIKKEVLEEQGAISLMDALRNTPGITLQLGENGNTSAGDTFTMRGFSTQSSIFVDGIRDLGPVTRDVFNLDQIEVSKGPSGADIGRGAASGYINLVSKLPSLDDATFATAAIDSGNTKRVSADANRKIGEHTAIRLNVMAQDGGQMGRKVIEREVTGIAPSIAFGLGTPTRVFLYSQHIRQDGVPDGGIPSVGVPGFYNANPDVVKAPMVDRNTFYGYASDYEKIDADMATVKVEHQFGESSTVTNTTRYGKSSMDRILTGVNAITAVNGSPQSAWTIARTRQSVLQDNRILANTTNVVADFKSGGLEHTVSAGLEFMSEEQDTPTRAAASLGTLVPANLYNPVGGAAPAAYAPVMSGVYSNGKTTTAAVYAFDTIKLNEQWSVNGGVRAEHYSTTTNAVAASTATTYPTLPVGTLVGSRLKKSDDLLSWKAGVLFKPASNGSIYGSFATSQTPPGSANFSLSTAAGNVNGPQMDPQKTTNLEFGTKWDLIEKKLAVTAAAYRTENTNEFSLLDANTNTYSQLGKRRVSGLEFGVVGQITRAWSVTGGLATMRAKIIEGSGTNVAGSDTRWSPELSATLWSSYKVNDALSFGGGVRYMGEQKRVVAPNAAPSNGAASIDSYAVVDAMVKYAVAKNISLQLNMYNLTDKNYVSTLNNGGSRLTIGVERSAQLSANFMF
jgi:catecholate siderophore receptor